MASDRVRLLLHNIHQVLMLLLEFLWYLWLFQNFSFRPGVYFEALQRKAPCSNAVQHLPAA